MQSFLWKSQASLKKSSKSVKMRFMRTSVTSICKFRWPRWPYTCTLANKLDACQRRLLYSLFPITRNAEEDIYDFFSRRHCAAARLANSSGKWSSLWAQDVLSWHDHVHRKHDPNVWSHHILSWRGNDWLNLQRLWHSAIGESRTRTRAGRGPVYRRWDEGVEYLISH